MGYYFDHSIICPWDITATSKRIKEYDSYYKVKYNIAKEMRPLKILEIGVRAGYSAYFFLQACPNAFYHGLDADNGKYGGQGPKSYVPWAEQLLREAGVRFRIDWPVDTQVLLKLPTADFYHIDGDHSEVGCRHDIDMCFKSANWGSVLVIDDYKYLKEVRRAIDGWVKDHPNVYVEFRDSLRGEFFIYKISDKEVFSCKNEDFEFRSVSQEDSMLQKWWKAGKFYEDKLLRKIREMGRKGVYVDVGANVGNHTVFMSKFCPSSFVVAIESSSIIARVLRINLQENIGDKGYKVLNCAVLAEEHKYEVDFINPKNVGNTQVRMSDEGEKGYPLDKILEGMKDIALVKIDTEGYETDVIIGAKNTILSWKPIVIAELKDKDSYKKFQEKLLGFGVNYVCDEINYAKTPTYIWKPI